MNDEDYVVIFSGGIAVYKLWFFFPEQREVTAFALMRTSGAGNGWADYPPAMSGSNDTTNGMDGTWETASFPGGVPGPNNTTVVDYWRSTIKAISFTGGKRTIRTKWGATGLINVFSDYSLVHLYGEKVAGQTPDDIIYIDHDTTPGVEFASLEDFGDQPLGTSVIRQFRLKNTSAALTANTINIQCNDTDFTIGETASGPWVATINIASLVPGAQSATLYTRCTTPAPGSVLGPRFNRIVTTVGSWS